MSWRSQKNEEKIEAFKRVRDLCYAFILLWTILLPADFFLILPVAGLTVAVIKALEALLGLNRD